MTKAILHLIFVFLFAVTFTYTSSAQVNVKDSLVAAPLLHFNYAYTIPGADMALRFGNFSAVGAGAIYKFRNNWIAGADGSFLFGGNVKENNILDAITTSDGYLIDREGFIADYYFSLRGWKLQATGGRIFRLGWPNKNSGIMATAGAGFVSHKIFIHVEESRVPQLAGDYRKGYDRLSTGPLFSQFLGYLFLDNNRLINFYSGVELTEGITHNRRPWTFDLNRQQDEQRFDLMIGFKFAFIIPLYKKSGRDGFYY